MAAQTPSEFPRSALMQRRQPYGWASLVSIGLHALLIAGFAAGALIGSCQPKIDPSQKPIAAKLVRLGKPRPKEWLPRKETAPAVAPVAKEAPVVTPGQAAAPAPPSPAAKPAPEPKAAPGPAPSTQSPATAAAAPKETKVDPRKRLDEILKRHKGGAIAGPAEEVSGQLDGDPEGDAEDAAEGERYLALLEKRIKDNYKLPSTISDQERIRLFAVLRIHVESNGRMSRWELVQSSGNDHFDSALGPALERAQPFPPPPPHMVGLMRSGLSIRFKP